MPVFLGLDCGGTSCKALAIDESERPVFEGRGGPGNLARVYEASIKLNLCAATVGGPIPDCVVGCFAGLRGSKAHLKGSLILSELWPHAKVASHPDYLAALSMAPSQTDLVVVSGTGSVVCSWYEGHPVKSGGNGPLLGDEGSSFDIARRALVLACHPGQSVPGILREGFLSVFGPGEPDDWIVELYQSPLAAHELARIAPFVIRGFEEGDKLCRMAVKEALWGLSEIVRDHTDRYFGHKPVVNVGITGGTWQASVKLVQEFAGHLNHSDPTAPFSRQYHVQLLDDAPALGAALMAKRLFYGH